MIFRIIDNKLYEIETTLSDKEFLRINSISGFQYISKLKTELPTVSNFKYEIFYMLDSNNNIIIDINRTLENAKKERYKKLENIFKLKWLQIQMVAIDKPYMGDPETIQAQIDSYQKLYEGALQILKDEPENKEALAIKAKYEEALALTTKVNLVMQKVRGLLEDKIEAVTDVNDTKVDELLTFANELQLSKENLTDEKLAEVLTIFEGQ